MLVKPDGWSAEWMPRASHSAEENLATKHIMFICIFVSLYLLRYFLFVSTTKELNKGMQPIVYYN